MTRKENSEERRGKERKNNNEIIIILDRLGVWHRPGQLNRRIESSQRQFGFGRQLVDITQSHHLSQCRRVHSEEMGAAGQPMN